MKKEGIQLYIPKQYIINDEEEMFDIIEQNGFATLFSIHEGKPYATHLPLTLDRKKRVLHGHFARPNKQWQDAGNQELLAVFQGPHCYISSSWYETNEAVPTWNYVAVHVYGTLKTITDNREIKHSLNKLVEQYEKADSTYSMSKVSETYLNTLNKGIVAFTIQIDKIEGAAKLSQHHSTERKLAVIKQLEQNPRENEQAIAKLMRDKIKE